MSLRGRLAPLILGMGWFPEQPGGLNRYLRGLVGALPAEADAQVVVLGPVTDPGFPGIQVTHAQEPLPLRLLRYARAARRAGKEASVVDAHFALYAFLPTIAGRLRSLPLVIHFQGPWAAESASAGEGRRWVLAAKRLVERSVYRRCREAVVLSGAFKRILVEGYRVPPWRISVIAPAVDLEHFLPGSRADARADLALDQNAWVGLAVRRMVPRMGLDVLLEAWRALAEGGQEAVLLLAGDGPGRLELQRQAAQAGLADKVVFLGAVSEQQLLACYRAADVCVVPSVALEGFGLVVLESLACGTPVIATDAGGLPEALAPLQESLVVPAGDAQALAARLRAALQGEDPLPDGLACRHYAERFSWDSVARRTLEVYQRAIDRPAPSRLRVVYLDHFAGLSGGELALSRLLPALDEVECHVLLAEDGPLVSHLQRGGVSVEVLPLADRARHLHRDQVRWGRLPWQAAANAAAYTVRLAWRLRRLQPDLVHTNSLKSALYGGIAGRLAGVPVVWHIRDRVAADYLPRSAVRLVRHLGRYLPRAVICNSASTLETLPQLRSSRGVIIHSPVPIFDPVPQQSWVGPRSLAQGREGLRIGMVGRLAPWKGQHIFIQGFAQAFPTGHCGTTGVQAVIVGAALFGEESYEQELKELARQHDLGGRLEFTGFTENVRAQLASFDILVHASVIPEPFGMVVVEGMAAGLPVVAPAAGGPAEVIADGVSGLLYPPADVDRLAQLLTLLADDAGLRQRLGEAARIRARDFSPEKIAPHVMAVYRQVLGLPDPAAQGPAR